MGFGDVWHSTLVYFGIAEEDEDWDDIRATSSALERGRAGLCRAAEHRTYAGSRAAARGRGLRRLDDAGRAAADEHPAPPRAARRGALAAACGPRALASTSSLPRSFNDAKQIADRLKAATPVILNLQSGRRGLSKRLIDFASGLTYALDGNMQRIADKVFLLTPPNVEVSAEERATALERGGFYNQA